MTAINIKDGTLEGCELVTFGEVNGEKAKRR